MSADDDPTTDDLVAEVRRRAAERRANGEYPPGLEDRLDAHFARVAARRAVPYDFDALRARLAAVDASLALDPARISAESGLPGGAALHRAVARAVSRQTAGILEQVSAVARAVRDALYEIAGVLEHPYAHRHPDLLGAIDEALDRLAGMQAGTAARGPGEVATAAGAPGHDVPAGLAARFAAHLASEGAGGDAVGAWARAVASRLPSSGSVAVLAPGDAALLALVAEGGATPVGVVLDGEVAARLRSEAPAAQVHVTEPLAWLRGTPEGSLAGVVADGLAERLPVSALEGFVAAAHRALGPGGTLVLAGHNPSSIHALLADLPLDPRVVRPVHPAFVAFAAADAGFGSVDVVWPGPAGEAGHPGWFDEAGGAASVLRDALAAPRYYAVVATR